MYVDRKKSNNTNIYLPQFGHSTKGFAKVKEAKIDSEDLGELFKKREGDVHVIDSDAKYYF